MPFTVTFYRDASKFIGSTRPAYRRAVLYEKHKAQLSYSTPSKLKGKIAISYYITFRYYRIAFKDTFDEISSENISSFGRG